jgi:hypothetical protein
LAILLNEALMSKTAGSIVEAALKRDPHEVEFIQSVQEVVHALERVIAFKFICIFEGMYLKTL